MNILSAASALFAALALMPAPIKHDLAVTLQPAGGRIEAVDSITLPEGMRDVRFELHSGLSPKTTTPGAELVHEKGAGGTESYRLRLPGDGRNITLKYGGVIHHPVEPMGKEQPRGEGTTSGIISEDGVFLSESSCFYPVFDGQGLLETSVLIDLPEGWDAVSQGVRTMHEKGAAGTKVRWEEKNPQEEIYIVAGRYTEYAGEPGKVESMAFLRAPDEGLAYRYLDATPGYIGMYSKLIGPYPYGKFALVENFYESGEAMPSFTLLGPRVLRLPFIVVSSYPHEILHDWWGNGVYPEMSRGNWSEGLTAYLADHLMKERDGLGARYRFETLEGYADYVRSGQDFPISRFQERHNPSTAAVGYGKSLMFFHMLRRKLGDEEFVKGLRLFYSRYLFRYASFTDIEKCLEEASGLPLSAEFEQWVTRTGAPELKLADAKSESAGDGYILTVGLEQVQKGDAYRLDVPVAVTMEGRQDASMSTVAMDGRRVEARISLQARPVRLDIDPRYDLFRRLDKSEIPPAVSSVLGAKKMLVVLPSKAETGLLDAYRELATALKESGPDEVEVSMDSRLTTLPTDRSVVVLGLENRFAGQAEGSLAGYRVRFTRGEAQVGKETFPLKANSLVFIGRNPAGWEMAMMLITADNPRALPGLGRKLPHYGKYGYLVFAGDGPDIVAKGQWPALGSPLTAFLPGPDGTAGRVDMGRLPPEKPLAEPDPAYSGARMMRTVRYLASKELEGRGFGSKGLDKAADFIAKGFKEAGLTPDGDTVGSYFQEWTDKGGEPVREALVKNVVGFIPGRNPAYKGQSVVVGAHYDHLGLGWPDVRKGNSGKVHPGADDNASGVAVLLELARVLQAGPAPGRSIVFVAFTEEEAGRRGSEYYVSHEAVFPARNVVGMVNLDTVGRLEGRKLLVLGAGSALDWKGILDEASHASGVDVGMVNERLDSSDNVSFSDAGVPAVQFFDGPNLDYHRPTDTADKVEPESLEKTASVASLVVRDLSERSSQLTAVATPVEREEGARAGRKTGIGTIPDFAYSGRGYRISGTVPGSSAESAGLRKGDVIVMVNKDVINGLKDFSDSLKSLSPGEHAQITFVRDGVEMTAEVTITAR